MIETFPMKFVDGHIIVSMKNKFDYLIDTGSPGSFGDGSPIMIAKRSFPINDRDLTGITVDSVNGLSGLAVHGLIGMNILSHFDIKFTKNHLIFSDTPMMEENESTSIILPIIEVMSGIPIINLNIDGNDQKIFLDTGAKISYLSDDLLVDPSIGQLDDFHPSIGKYKTNIYHNNVKINERIHRFTFGSLPSPLKSLLVLSRTKGVIGTELFQTYSVTLSNLTKALLLEPYEE